MILVKRIKKTPVSRTFEVYLDGEDYKRFVDIKKQSGRVGDTRTLQRVIFSGIKRWTED